MSNPVDAYRSHIASEVARVSAVDADKIQPALDWTRSMEHGDLVLAVPRLQVKGKKPIELAKEWAEAIPQTEWIKKPQAIGIQLRFDFLPDTLASKILPQILSKGDSYGFDTTYGLRDVSNPAAGRKRAMIEFSSPNIAKEFHVGHLRSTIIGAFLSKLYESMGWDVFKMNYLGDWGRQYGLLAVGWHRYGDEARFSEDPIAHLLDVYVKISAELKPEEEAYQAAKKRKEDTAELENTGLLGEAKRYFKRMEDGDPEAVALWRKFRDISIENYKGSYERLDVHFDEYSGESKVEKESMDRVERVLQERGVMEPKDGAMMIDFKKHGAKNLDVAIMRNRNGTSNYLVRDVGSALQRWERYGADEIIYVIMSEQDVHVQRLFKTLELMGEPYADWSKKMKHITFGKIQGMSTRKGTVKFLGQVLDDIGTSMHEVMRRNEDKYQQVQNPAETADTLGISAILVQDFSGKRINNYKFELERMLSFEGDTGPYLQYAHARLCSINRKTGYTRTQLSQADLSLLQESHAVDLTRSLASFPDIVSHTYRINQEPSTIVTYLFKLTHALSSSYDHLKIIGAREGPEVSLARAALYEAARQVLRNGMMLLGLRPVESM
ncbi:MAG: hypothetical protein M1828_006522 [Chrysothrix sp. TS-e1954]|nr:MAG: hypothetical protein M1828_006522 [Chrysothrix sp. TS-e1954]